MAEARADTLQTVELADGVEIQLRVAGPAVRSMAYLIDLIIRIGIDIVMAICAHWLLLGLIGEDMTRGLSLLFAFFMEWFYNVFFEAGAKGATPGQRSMKLRVMSVTGGPVSVAQAVMRNFLRVVDFMPGLYLTGVVCMLFTKRFQRLGDLVANTVVTYAEVPQSIAPHVEIRAERRAPSQVLTREEQAALLQFLERAPLWADERRIELATLVQPLTEATGVEGLRRLCGMALWLQAPEDKSGSPPPLKGAAMFRA
ncbi:MAG: RDD family protein [Prosthecobacter sp.]|uniref:RDD family protein n=1 Tax=Prosthecobacter sp. TaxID=1965333 RepID=UPI003BB1C8BD